MKSYVMSNIDECALLLNPQQQKTARYIAEQVSCFNLTSGHFQYYCAKQEDKKAIPPIGMEELILSKIFVSHHKPLFDVRWRMVETTDLNKKGWRTITVDCRVVLAEDGGTCLGAYFQRSKKISRQAIKRCLAVVEGAVLPFEENIWKDMLSYTRYLFRHRNSLTDLPNRILLAPTLFIDQDIMLKRLITKMIALLEAGDLEAMKNSGLIDTRRLEEYQKYDPQPILEELSTSIERLIKNGFTPSPRFERFHPETIIDIWDPNLPEEDCHAD